jgi:hypothetical protein
MASALGYFFLSGLRTFALIYARGRFGIGQGLATLLFLLIGAAAVAGVLVSGRWTDRLIHRGHVNARLVVGGAGFLVAAAVFVPALLTGSVLVGLPLFLLAAFALSAPNPPLDAARLDVVPSMMWGRAESIRTTVRIVLEALAPVIFGLQSGALGGATSGGLGSGVNENNAHVSSSGTTGLEYTFLIMVVALAGAGVLLIRARHTYLKDVATAAASERTDAGSVVRRTSRQPAAAAADARRDPTGSKTPATAQSSRSGCHPRGLPNCSQFEISRGRAGGAG